MRVLFVEDDAMNRKVVNDMMRTVGAELVEAESAEIGLELVDRETFNVILMDLRMPGMDGLTAIHRIRARDDDKARLPIIVVTADTAVDIREQCLAAGADEVIMKPVAMRRLFEAVGRVMVEAEKRTAGR